MQNNSYRRYKMEYKVAGVPVQAEDLGNVLKHYAGQNNEVGRIEGCSEQYVADVLAGKKQVDARHAKGFVQFLNRKAVREVVAQYVMAEYGNNNLEVKQSEAIKKVAGGLSELTSALVEVEGTNAKRVDALEARVGNVEKGLKGQVTKDDLTKAKSDVRSQLRKEMEDYVQMSDLDTTRAELTDAYEGAISNATKKLASGDDIRKAVDEAVERAVEDAVQRGHSSPEAHKLVDEAISTVDAALAVLRARKK
jgi:hypothetical protein